MKVDFSQSKNVYMLGEREGKKSEGRNKAKGKKEKTWQQEEEKERKI